MERTHDDRIRLLSSQMREGYQDLPEEARRVMEHFFSSYTFEGMEYVRVDPWLMMLSSRHIGILNLMHTHPQLNLFFNSFDNLWLVLLEQLILKETDEDFHKNYPIMVMSHHRLISMGYDLSHMDNKNFQQLLEKQYLGPSEGDILKICDEDSLGDTGYTSFIEIYHKKSHFHAPERAWRRLSFVSKILDLLRLFDIVIEDTGYSSELTGKAQWVVVIEWLLSMQFCIMCQFMIKPGNNQEPRKFVLLNNNQVHFLRDLQVLGRRVLSEFDIDHEDWNSYSPENPGPEEFRDMLFKNPTMEERRAGMKPGLYDTPDKQKTLFLSEFNALVKVKTRVLVDKYKSTPFLCVVCKKGTCMVNAQLALPFCSVWCKSIHTNQ